MTPAETVIAITEALAPLLEEARGVGLHFTVLIASDPGQPPTAPPAVFSLLRERVGRLPWSLGWDRSLNSCIYSFRELIREEMLRERGLPSSSPRPLRSHG